MTTAPAVFTPLLERFRHDVAAQLAAGPVVLERTGYEERAFSWVMRLTVRREATREVLSHAFLKVAKPVVLNGDVDLIRQRVVRDHEITSRVYRHMQKYRALGWSVRWPVTPRHLPSRPRRPPG